AVRERAVRALAGRGPGAAPALAGALADPDRHVRRTVWECAASLAPVSRAAFKDAVLTGGAFLERIQARLRLRPGPKRPRG
ncbi:MAG: hypothetical protein GXP48_00265, partial [Acidobacteria bacterium]|nr:hypothetical protein [Acidobacteriota bacterium]